MEFYSAYKPAPAVNVECDPDGNMTEQQHALDCDINNIIERYQRTGILGDPFANPTNSPQYGNFIIPDGFDYRAAMTQIVTAQQEFDALPSTLRERFHNDPGKLLDFLGKEENRDEAIRLGLISGRSDSGNGQSDSSTSGGTT